MSTEPINADTIPPADSHDWFLQLLVNQANYNGLNIGITLQVSGFLVSGVLVGAKAYFEAFAEDFSSAYPGAETEKSRLKSIFAECGEDMHVNDDNDTPKSPQYIHLKDTRFFNTSGKPIPGNKGVWWRGRISEVGGFTLGNLTQAEG